MVRGKVCWVFWEIAMTLFLGCSTKEKDTPRDSSDPKIEENIYGQEAQTSQELPIELDSLKANSISNSQHSYYSGFDVSVNPYYDEGFEQGQEDGYNDGIENLRGDSYDDACRYKGKKKRKEYELGYEEGYESVSYPRKS
ncbi:MAG TPA: hypothetical protein DCW90_24135, partial [Lachnospiraceae bacterium]|nr:hypothetical protein [Lachnospiraceae bacterium]